METNNEFKQLSLNEEKESGIAKPLATKSVSPGDMLEYRARRLLFYMGYFARGGITLKTSNEDNSEKITDLDAFGIYVHTDFHRKNLWIDCKSGKAKTLEHITWITGVRQFCQIDDVIFLKSSVKASIKEYARKLDIHVVDMDHLKKLEKDFGIDTNDWAGSYNPKLLATKFKEFSKIVVPNNEIYKKIARFISSDYWSSSSYGKVKKCIYALQSLATQPLDTLEENEKNATRWAIYELTALFVLAITEIVRELYYFTENEKYNALLNGMISGEIPPKKRADIIEAAYKLAFSMVQSQVPDFKPPVLTDEYTKLSPPHYFEALLDLINRVTHNPKDYFDVPRFLDYVLMEFDLNNKDYDWRHLDLVFRDVERKTRAAKTFLHFLGQIKELSTKPYKLISR